MEETDAEAIAARVAACPSVVRLAPRRAAGEVATYLPGRRVGGVRVRGDGIEVSVVGRWGVTVPDLAAEIRRAAAPLAGGRPVLVHVEDIDAEIDLSDMPERRPDGVTTDS